VIGVKVGDEKLHGAERDAHLPEPCGARSTAVEDQSLVTRFDEGARTESIHERNRTARPEQGDLELRPDRAPSTGGKGVGRGIGRSGRTSAPARNDEEH